MIDLRKPGWATAVLLTPPRGNLNTIRTVVLGFAIAQIPRTILLLQGGTFWQSSVGLRLLFGRALDASVGTPSGSSLILALAIIAPIIEEMLYRGYLFGALIRRVSGPVAVFVSSCVFVIFHFEFTSLATAFSLGIGTGICALRTRSIIPGIIVHMASSAVGLYFATMP